MAAFALALSLDDDPETPVFLQIARAVVQGALRGRIRPGEALLVDTWRAAEAGPSLWSAKKSNAERERSGNKISVFLHQR